jgi:hypothetical protein
MAASKQASKDQGDHVVIAIRRRGLNAYASVYGPFTKARAHVFATHHQMYEGEECSVEELETPCVHNKWIFEGVS